MSGVRLARMGFLLIAWLFLVGAVIEVYLAGQAIFVTESYELHRNFGFLFGVLTLVLLILSFAARMPGRVVAASGLLVIGMLVQVGLIVLSDSQPNLAALHPVNGFLIVALALWLALKSLGQLRAPIPVELKRADDRARGGQLDERPAYPEPARDDEVDEDPPSIYSGGAP